MPENQAEPIIETYDWAHFIIQSIPVGIFTVDSQMRITDFNPRAEELTGYPRSEALGKFCADILRSNLCHTDCPLRQAMAQKTALEREAVIENRDGKKIPVTLCTAALRNDQGELLGGVETFRDITLLKKQEEERRNLVSMFAHDLKTPVVAIGGLTNRLRRGKLGPLSDSQASYLETIDQEMQRLEDLINNFLEFARLQLHEIKPLPSSIQVEKECQEVLALLEPIAESRGVTLIAEYPEEILVIEADPQLFRRVLENLLENAIKYSRPQTVVTLTVQSLDQEIVFRVQDQGTGIPPEDLSHLFEIFFRGTDPKRPRGFGLGLATVKTIIEAHGGKIWVESEPGRGSIFSFSLPRLM
ncbi:MAG: PAS domain-containing sensor histidine kinase [Deltaproteobacteria bacterium]|nr:PAS domain-containing sensor histidine kinase [Deltaproteobacteria bacterium]